MMFTTLCHDPQYDKLIYNHFLHMSHLVQIGENLEIVMNYIQQMPLPPMLGHYLMVIRDQTPLYYFPLEKGVYQIGRESSCNMVLNAQQISRRHCMVEEHSKGIWILNDMHSQNGFQVNGRPLTKRILCDGDLIHIAPYTLIYLNHCDAPF